MCQFHTTLNFGTGEGLPASAVLQRSDKYLLHCHSSSVRCCDSITMSLHVGSLGFHIGEHSSSRLCVRALLPQVLTQTPRFKMVLPHDVTHIINNGPKAFAQPSQCSTCAGAFLVYTLAAISALSFLPPKLSFNKLHYELAAQQRC